MRVPGSEGFFGKEDAAHWRTLMVSSRPPASFALCCSSLTSTVRENVHLDPTQTMAAVDIRVSCSPHSFRKSTSPTASADLVVQAKLRLRNVGKDLALYKWHPTSPLRSSEL